MQVKIENTLDDYIDSGNDTCRQLLQENGSLIRALREFDRYFIETLWRDGNGLSPIPAIVAMNAFMLFLAGVRMAMSGHSAAVFPVLRTSLESACYAYRMVEKPELVDVWLDREKCEEGRRRCRQAFTSAVRETAMSIEREQSGGGSWILDMYEADIDFGAHPNIRSVFGHVRSDERSDAYIVSLTGLHGPGGVETLRGLAACMDHALAVAVVLTRALPSPSQHHQDQLFALNELKNRVASEFICEE